MGLFSSGFKDKVQQFAKGNNWKIHELADDHVYLEFQGETSGDVQQVWIMAGEEDWLDFVAPMSAGYEDDDDVPHDFSTYLLQRNNDLDPGYYWYMEEIDGEQTYCCCYGAYADEIDSADFGAIVSELVNECDEVEAILDEEEEE